MKMLHVSTIRKITKQIVPAAISEEALANRTDEPFDPAPKTRGPSFSILKRPTRSWFELMMLVIATGPVTTNVPGQSDVLVLVLEKDRMR